MALTKPYSKDTPSTVTLDDGSVRDVPERMTVEEFEAFPWPDESNWEMIWEVPVLTPKPEPPHQYLADEIKQFLKLCLAKQRELYVCGEVDIRLPHARSYVAPDVVVVDESKVDTASRPMDTVPLLVAEVLSPSTAALDTGAKRDAYAEAGVPEYWVVDPQTGAVALHVSPEDGLYQQPPADPEGYVTSPLLGVTFRVSREGNRFNVLRR
ncbi:MAG: Uma2 family endonuclease [Planctomycetes bacterium]|nr:Uma2 family endonuclease [Planctomycetota bacterium]